MSAAINHLTPKGGPIMKKEKAYTKLFENLIRKRGWGFRQASKHEDMFDHIDCHVTVMNGSKAVRVCSIDLKGTK